MKLSTTYIFSFLLVAGFSPAWGQRGTVWVHGLNDNASQWNQWATLFDTERDLAVTSRQTWQTRDGVGNMATNIMNAINADAQTIYFGHSMGGVVGRDIDARPGEHFGGYIMAGAPLDGARIANTTRNGEASNMIFDGVDVVTRGPSRQFFSASWIISGIVVGEIVRAVERTWDIFGIRDLGHQGSADLMEDSGYMNSGVRNAQTNTPKVLIYGNEDAPGCWRLVSQAIGNGDDEQYVSVARTAGDVYEAFMWANWASVALSFPNVFGMAAFAYTAVGWMNGMNWWRYDSDRGWNYLIGASSASYQSVCYLELNTNAYADCLLFSAETPEDYERCRLYSMQPYCHYYYAQVNGQSDAFIKAPSQTGYNSTWANNATRIEARGVNHLEMKKHERMRDIYRQIFNGNGVDPFFSTP